MPSTQSRDVTDASAIAPDPQTVLLERFGLREFRDGQREVIDCLLGGGGALAVFPTGGGKSLCYQLPALLLDGVTVVVSPLIALMKDQIDYLRGR
ncbi:MAG TPA: DEAD/DEAH box helicase, partial [Longimicrobium sp.]